MKCGVNWMDRGESFVRISKLEGQCHHVATPLPMASKGKPLIELVLYCDGRCGGRQLSQETDCDRGRATSLWLFAKASSLRTRLRHSDVIKVSADLVSRDPELLRFGPDGNASTIFVLDVLPYFSGFKRSESSVMPGELREKAIQLCPQTASEPRDALVVLKSRVWRDIPDQNTTAPDSLGSGELAGESPQVQEIRMNVRCAVHTAKRKYKIAISYASTRKETVVAVAEKLAVDIGRDSLFLDEYKESDLADPAIMTTLQRAFEEDSQLAVVFCSEEYSESKWCLSELNFIKNRIFREGVKNVMFVSLDRSSVPGFDEQAGSLRAENYSPERISQAILQRFNRIDNESTSS